MIRLYRLLLCCFPRQFRRRFGDDMTAVFADRLQAARGRGLAAAGATCSRAVGDTVRHGLAERRLARRHGTRRDPMLSSLFHDIRYGTRALRKNPGVTLTAVATLALGIGATTAVFSVADALMLSPLPFPNSERIVSLNDVNPERGFSGNVAVPNFDDWRAGVDAIEAGAAWTASEVNLAGVDGAERVSAGLITGEFFDIVGAAPLIGRVFGDDAREPGLDEVVVLSEGAWTRLYNRAPDAVGRTAVLEGVPHAVVGVVPAVVGLEHIEVWRPLARTGGAASRRNHAYRAYVRLRPDVTIEQAAAQFDVVARNLEIEYPESNGGWRVALTPLQQEFTVGLDRTIALVGSIVGIVLLIACANVAGLLLSRVADRHAEFAVRTALGANRGRLARQVLTESVLLSLVGAAAGLLIAVWATGALTNVIVGDGGVWRTPTLSWPVLTMTTVVSVGIGLLFGLAPALTLRRAAPHDQLRSGRAATGTGRRGRSALALAQLALASVLLVASAVVLTGLYRALQVDPGFDPQNVMTFRVTPPAATHADGRALDGFFTELSDRLSTFNAVRAVGATSNLPMAGNSTIRGVIRPGDPVPEMGEEQLVLYQVSTPGYVAASGMRLLEGRDFTTADTDTGRPVALINESMARILWPDGRAVGREILIFTDEETPREVVGVLADIRYRGLDRPVLPQYYVPFSQAPRRTMTVALRLNGSLPLGDVRNTVESIDASLPVYEVRMLEALMRDSLSDRRALTTTVALFGGLAVLLAAIGLNGIVATGVRERRREIGIRLAVGATTSDVRRLFVKQGLTIAGAAVVIGVGLSYVLLGLGRQLLAELELPGPAVLAGVSVLVLGIALVATWLPARHATRIDPVETLRDG